MSAKVVFEKVSDCMYKSRDGITYDLTALKDLHEDPALRLKFKAEKDGQVVQVITNGDGEGQWVESETVFGPEYHQVAGTIQYRIPDEDWRLCQQLRGMWIERYGVRVDLDDGWESEDEDE